MNDGDIMYCKYDIHWVDCCVSGSTEEKIGYKNISLKIILKVFIFTVVNKLARPREDFENAQFVIQVNMIRTHHDIIVNTHKKMYEQQCHDGS